MKHVVDPGLTLLVGLGNPGSKYEQTRHNAGFWFVDRVAERLGASFRNEGKFQGHAAEAVHRGRKIHLLKPMTYMNLSGQSVQAYVRYYDIPLEQLLIAHDELDLPPGAVKLKFGGGYAGHNGLIDMGRLGNPDFWRLRIGIGRPTRKGPDYLLERPGKAERVQIDEAIANSLDALELMLDGQMGKAMQQLHSKPMEAKKEIKEE
jgi:peptidyl-tRNA hydrolase, PTH1 family